MTNTELIKKLQEFPENTEILSYSLGPTAIDTLLELYGHTFQINSKTMKKFYYYSIKIKDM